MLRLLPEHVEAIALRSQIYRAQNELAKAEKDRKRETEIRDETAEILRVACDTTLDPAKTYKQIIIEKSGIVLDGKGARLRGPKFGGKPNTYIDTAISALGVNNVTLKNLVVEGWGIGLRVENGSGWLIENCHFCDNFHDPDFGWGETPQRGGIILTHVKGSTIRKCKANRVWNGCVLVRSDENKIEENDFSYTSNTCLKFWTSSRNQVTNNKLDYGIRKKPNEVHARDSTCVLLEAGSNDNRFIDNSMTHGGDGIFLRSLNQWVSTGNYFEKNDCSYANNNCVECSSPGNIFVNNKANHGSYGFWMGGSDKTVLLENEVSHNGEAEGNHNAPHFPGNGHAGIVFMFGTSSHVIARGNKCIANNGAGIAVIGDIGTQGKKWKARHWIIEQNTLNENRWGIYTQYADWIQIAANTFEKNVTKDIQIGPGSTHVFQMGNNNTIKVPPKAKIKSPSALRVGEKAVFDASGSEDPAGNTLQYRWNLGDDTMAQTAKVEQVFSKPGFYRIGLTVSNGLLSDLAWIDLYVLSKFPEIGTEGEAKNWSWQDPQSKVKFVDDTDIKLQGKSSILATINPYGGFRCNLIYSRSDKEDIGLKENAI